MRKVINSLHLLPQDDTFTFSENEVRQHLNSNVEATVSLDSVEFPLVRNSYKIEKKKLLNDYKFKRKTWGNVKVIFIQEVGTTCHGITKYFRPMRLSSPFLKNLELFKLGTKKLNYLKLDFVDKTSPKQ